MHILDVAENSVRAEASVIEISIIEKIKEDQLIIRIKDNGKGMDKDFLEKVFDPFTTSRTTRRVGLGLPFFKAAAEECGGNFEIDSIKGEGTWLEATFQHSHIDRVPLGNMADTIVSLLLVGEEVDWIYTHTWEENKFFFSTVEVKKILVDLPITNLEVINWIKGHIEEGLKDLVEK
nr:ATP-binding protein [Alkaliphilus hydrothermalis]